MTYIYALLTGFFLAFGFGPVFFTILQTSLEKGVRAGFFIIYGTFISDVLLSSITYLGLFSMELKSEWGHYFKIAGILVLIAFGSSQLILSKKSTRHGQNAPFSPIGYFIKGLAMNVLNPMNLITWTAIIFSLRSNKLSSTEETLHILLILGSVFAFEFLLSHFSNRLNPFFTSKNIKWMKRIVSVVMFLAAIKLSTTL